MLGRALSLATVTLLIGCSTAERAQAQAQNLEAGKSPSQIFAGTCSACHKSPRGLLKTVPAGSLAGFLRQHYTTSPDMANVLSSYLASNGATDTRYVGAQPKGGKDGTKDGKDGAKDGGKEAARDAKPDARPDERPDHLDRFGRRQRPSAASQEAARPEAKPEPRTEPRAEPRPEAKPDAEPPREAARPDAEEGAGAPPPAEPEPAPAGRPSGRTKRQDAKRLARPADAPEDRRRPGVDGQAPARAAVERGPDGHRLSAKQKLSKRGRPGSEEPPRDQGKDGKDPFKEFFREQPNGDTARDEPPGAEPARGDTAKIDPGKSDSSRPDSTNSLPGRPDEAAAPAGEGSSPSAKVDPSRDTDTPAPRMDQPVASVPPPAVAASAPPSSPPPAGPPTPPISQ